MTSALSPVPNSTGGQLDVFELVQLIRNRWLTAFVGALVIGSGVYAYSRFVMAPYFTSRGVILVPLKEAPSGGLGGLSSAIAQIRGGSSNDELAQYDMILRTEKLQTAVKSKLGLKELRANWRTSGPTLIIEASQPDAQTAEKVVSTMISELESVLIAISAKKAETNKRFFEARLREAEDSMISLERQLNQLRVSQGQREYSIQSKILGLLREQFEISQIEAKKEQKSFVVIDPPLVASERTGPARVKAGVTGFFVAFMGLLFLLVSKDLIHRELAFRRRLNSSGIRPKSESSSWVN